MQLTKPLVKKLKLGKDAIEAVVLRFIEAQLAFEYQGLSQLPVQPDPKLGQTHELLTLADARVLDKQAVEDLIAYMAQAPPAEIAVRVQLPESRCDLLGPIGNARCRGFRTVWQQRIQQARQEGDRRLVLLHQIKLPHNSPLQLEHVLAGVCSAMQTCVPPGAPRRVASG